MIRFLMIGLVMCASVPAVSQECGPETPCQIDAGSYHMRIPVGEGPHPVLLWYHGHRGNGASIHNGGGLQRDFLDQGYIVLAPNGYRSGDGPRSYPARDGAPRDDVAFTFEVLKDAGARASVDKNRIYVGGFSAGGSMAWLLACEAGEHLSGMVSVAGALRAPNATTCAGLTDLPVLQIHGFGDAQVPFEGRGIRDWHQGSVWDSLKHARAANGCRSNPDSIQIDAEFRTRTWDDSCAGASVRLDVHDGGHGLPQGWTERARAFFEGKTSNP
ncbi:MAG: PHB depolymerase family esterase [Roseobacter sp.]